MEFFVILVLVVAGASAQDSQNVPQQEYSPVNVGSDLINALFDSPLIQNKINRFLQLVDLKIRLVKLVRALTTQENLLLFRQVLDFVTRVCNFVSGFLPEPVESSDGSFLQQLFPMVQNEDQRVVRHANLTSEDISLLEKHQNDVLQVAKLIYNTP